MILMSWRRKMVKCYPLDLGHGSKLSPQVMVMEFLFTFQVNRQDLSQSKEKQLEMKCAMWYIFFCFGILFWGYLDTRILGYLKISARVSDYNQVIFALLPYLMQKERLSLCSWKCFFPNVKLAFELSLITHTCIWNLAHPGSIILTDFGLLSFTA